MQTMVVFSCDGCGETLKKNKVDAHAAKCRECHAVSCMDCSVSFPGDDYRSHTSCVTEAERYEKTVFKGIRKGDSYNKGKVLSPQERWNLSIHKAVETAPSSLKPYMKQLALMECVPRKEKQFRNFAANSLKLRNGRNDAMIVSEIWNLLIKERQEKEKNDRRSESNEKTPIRTTDLSENKEMITVENDVSVPSDGDVKKVMKKVLKKSSGKKLKFKELRNTVKDILLLKVENGEVRKKLQDMDTMCWKETLQRIIKKNPKKMILDGKIVMLVNGT